MVLDLFTNKITSLSFSGEGEGLPPASYLHIDKEKGLWIGTLNEGVLFFDKDSILHKFTAESNSSKKIMSNRIRSIFEDSRENIWVLTNMGATKFSRGTSKDYMAGLNTNVLTEAADKTLWMGTIGNGVFVKKKNSLKFQPFFGDGPKKLPAGLVVETIHADDQNRIWIGTYGEGLYLVNTGDHQITHLLPDRQNPWALSFQDILTIKEDRKGGIWIGSDGGGVNYYNRQFNSFKTLAVHDVDKSISIEQIRAVVTDEEGTIWIGTSGQGLTSYDPFKGEFETFHLDPFKAGISNYDRIVSLQVDGEGDLWIGTQGNGLLIIDRLTKKIKKWFTTEAVAEKENIPDNTVWSILPEKNEHAWIATRNAGLLFIDKEKGVLKKFILPSTENEVEGRNVQNLIKLNPSTLALGVEERGIQLFHIPSGKFTAVTNKKIEKILNREASIKSFFYDNDWLWAGTAGKGIIITNLKTGKTILLNDKNWLPNNMIYSILPQGKEVVWISSNKGIFKLSYTSGPEKIKIRGILHFTAADGLQSNEFNTGAYHRSREGVFFFGGISGLTYFHPNSLSLRQEDLSTVLTKAMVGNRPMKGDTLITYKNRLDLPYRQNSLSFNYTGFDFISPENLNFQYRLKGYDEEWIEAGNRNYTAYTNLPPNDYIFQVKVSDKISAEAPYTSLFISIAVPYWQQSWFIALSLFFILAVIYGLHRYRIHQLLQVQRVKNSISADLHDDLGARLTNIQFLSALSKNKYAQGEEGLKILKGIEEEIQASAQALDEIVWNIKMEDESLEEVVAKMRKYSGELLEKEYTYQIEVRGDFSHKKMSMRKRRELFLIFKELLNNIRKHAEATEVAIKISIDEGMFLLIVKDNGRGFDPRKESRRNGLRNVKERVEKWNGSMQLWSEKNRGTWVSFRLPFDHPWYKALDYLDKKRN